MNFEKMSLDPDFKVRRPTKDERESMYNILKISIYIIDMRVQQDFYIKYFTNQLNYTYICQCVTYFCFYRRRTVNTNCIYFEWKEMLTE